MTPFIAPHYQRLLQQHQLTHLKDWWSLDLKAIDQPNTRKKFNRFFIGKIRLMTTKRATISTYSDLPKSDGSSSVSLLSLNDNGMRYDFYVKKQNYFCRKTLRHPWRGEPLVQQEWRALLCFQKHHIPCADLVFYQQEGAQAILVTRALDNYQPLDQCWPDFAEKKAKQALMMAIARVLRQLHDQGYMHNCLYPKHIFVNKDLRTLLTQPEYAAPFAPLPREGQNLSLANEAICLIDLEKVRYWPLTDKRRIRDLETLYFHAPFAGPREWVYLLRYYFGQAKLSNTAKKLWRKIEKYSKKRRHTQHPQAISS